MPDRIPTRRRSAAGDTKLKVRLRPANPFDLIRLIALSQSDPRKAMAELVQNALDAGARNVTITRQRRRKEIVISVLDDGHGVFPEMERARALEHGATHIGHSFKRNLSAAERQQQMLLGKYDIGQVQAYELDSSLWSSGHLEGIVEFPTRASGAPLGRRQGEDEATQAEEAGSEVVPPRLPFGRRRPQAATALHGPPLRQGDGAAQLWRTER